MQSITTLLLYLLLIAGCENFKEANNKMSFTEQEILEELDLSFQEKPGNYFPNKGQDDIQYNFFPDLEHGYFFTAGNRIHLYADSTRWAIVFEKSGYANRGYAARIELDYFGNCVNYVNEEHNNRKYVTNSQILTLISPEEFNRIKDSAESSFELISTDTKQIKIRDTTFLFDNNLENYKKLGINSDIHDNPKNLISFEDLIRYLNETNPSLISASEKEIRQNIPQDIPKIMTIEKFHFESWYEKSKLPSQQETYQLIAKILISGDSSNWKPTLKANNHWSNWESGHL